MKIRIDMSDSVPEDEIVIRCKTLRLNIDNVFGSTRVYFV